MTRHILGRPVEPLLRSQKLPAFRRAFSKNQAAAVARHVPMFGGYKKG